MTPGAHTVKATFNRQVKTVAVAPVAGESVKAAFDFARTRKGIARDSAGDGTRALRNARRWGGASRSGSASWE